MMEGKRIKAVFTDCIKKHWGAALLLVIYITTSLVIFKLYNLLLEPFIYVAVLICFFALIFFAVDFVKEINHAIKREHTISNINTEWNKLPQVSNLMEADYQEMIRALGKKADELAINYENERHDMLDYYTIWVHQIKTPIAVMRLMIGNEDTEEHRALSAELFRIEQYVDMVLQYIRLGSESNDLVIKEYKLDDLIRESVRKYAQQFIYRKLRLNYESTDIKIVTDRKWFLCILEQILSNAVKYTPQGTVSIKVSDDGKLRITDTGIGIAAEDLPRIFEKGYTGNNGRLGQKSSGLGLYLCKKAANMLSIKISAESTPGKGTTFIMDLHQDEAKLD